MQYKADTGAGPWLGNLSWAVRSWTGCERAQRGGAPAGDDSAYCPSPCVYRSSTAKCSTLTPKFDLPSPLPSHQPDCAALQPPRCRHGALRCVLRVLSFSDVVPPSLLCPTAKAVTSFLSHAAAAQNRVTHTTASFLLPLCSIATFGSLRDDENKEVSRL